MSGRGSLAVAVAVAVSAAVGLAVLAQENTATPREWPGAVDTVEWDMGSKREMPQGNIRVFADTIRNNWDPDADPVCTTDNLNIILDALDTDTIYSALTRDRTTEPSGEYFQGHKTIINAYLDERGALGSAMHEGLHHTTRQGRGGYADWTGIPEKIVVCVALANDDDEEEEEEECGENADCGTGGGSGNTGGNGTTSNCTTTTETEWVSVWVSCGSNEEDGDGGSCVANLCTIPGLTACVERQWVAIETQVTTCTG